MPVVRPWQRHRDHRFLRRAPENSSSVAPGQPAGDRANPISDKVFVDGLRPIPSGTLETARPLPTGHLSGTSPDGRPIEVTLDQSGQTLLAFLAARCDGCEAFWHGLGTQEPPILPAGLACVVITRSAARTDVAQIAWLAAGIHWPVVMSDEAWTEFQVMSYPVFVLVDGPSRSVVAETVGFGWDDVLEMVASAD